MKRYMLLHVGFEMPTPEIMQAWNAWFESVADRAVEHGGFHGPAREMTKNGVVELKMGPGAITGYSIIKAADIDEAAAIAGNNPFIDSIRVYEIS
ncbi:MAG: hypothetical protein AAF458_21430 [Pseudomonadota bacterium]